MLRYSLIRKRARPLLLALCALAFFASSPLLARMKNPCAEIPPALRPPPDTSFKSPVLREWASIRKTLAEIDQPKYRPVPNDHKDPVLDFKLEQLPGTGPSAFTGRKGVKSRILFYFPGDSLNCVVVESRSLQGGSQWDYGFFLVPVSEKLAPVFVFRGPGRAPYPRFEERDLTEQLELLRQLHRNVRAALYYLERRRVSDTGKRDRDREWQIDK
jgi:hypothetical protein